MPTTHHATGTALAPAPQPRAPEAPAFLSLLRVRSPRHARTLFRLVLAQLAFALGVLFLPWVQSVSGTGRVVAYTPLERRQTIDAPIDGRVLRFHVSEGSRVREGDLIAEMSDNDPEILLNLERERLALSARLDAANLRASALSDRILGVQGSRSNALNAALSRVSMANDRVQAAERAVEAASATLDTARLNLDRQKRLLDRGLASTRTLELAQLDSVRAQTELDRARAALNAARSEKLALDADRDKIESDFRSSLEDAKASQLSARAEIANAQAELQRLQVRLNRQNMQLVRAPRAGTIFRLVAQPGSSQLKSASPLAEFIPDNSAPVVELFIKGNDIPLISEGRHVRLQFEGWPALQFSGWPSVAVGTFGAKVLLVDSADDGQGKFRILVAPDPASDPWPAKHYLRQGVRANGWVLLNTVPLWYELWRQFNGFSPALSPSSTPEGAKKK